MSSQGRAFVRSTSLLLAVGLIALAVIVGTTIWLGEQARLHFDAASEVRAVRAAAVESREAVQAAESAYRGFLLQGNQIYLAPYDTAKRKSQKQLRALTAAISAAGEPSSTLPRLNALLQQKFVDMDESIALKRQRRDPEAMEMNRLNGGKALMDEVNVFFAGIIRSADNRSAEGMERQKANATRLRWVSTVGGLVILAVVFGGSAIVHRYTRELASARDEVRSLNANLERRVEERTEDLARANEEVRWFTHVVSHDLRAPLINITGFTNEIGDSVTELQALAQHPSAASDAIIRRAVAATSEMPEALRFIRSSTTKMNRLINAILLMSREGSRTPVAETVNVHEIISASANAIQHQLSEAGGKISFAIDVPPIQTDRLSLEQVFGNLIENCSKYRSGQRPLRIAVRGRRLGDDRIEIEVADNGRGIADDDQSRVFDLFKRSGPQDQAGEGVGLAHVRAALRKIGGDISLVSKLDVGTTFRVVLPREFMTRGVAA